MALTEKKIRVYRLLFDLIWKTIYSFACLIAFFVVLGFLIYFCFNSGGLATTAPLAALDALLAGTLYVVVRHYFPKRK